MRIFELLENIQPQGPLSPAEYAIYAQQRNAERKQKELAAQQKRQQQQAQQQTLWQALRARKPKPIKSRAKRKRKTGR